MNHKKKERLTTRPSCWPSPIIIIIIIIMIIMVILIIIIIILIIIIIINNNNNKKGPGYDLKLHPVVEFRRGRMRLPFATTTSRSPLGKV